MKAPTEQSVSYRVMTCPCCGYPINADVKVGIRVGEARVTKQPEAIHPKAVVHVSSEIVQFNVVHNCPGRDGDVAS